MNYRIYQDSNGYHVQEDRGEYPKYPTSCLSVGYAAIWKCDWVTVNTYKNLKHAKKEKNRLEIIQGRVIE